MIEDLINIVYPQAQDIKIISKMVFNSRIEVGIKLVLDDVDEDPTFMIEDI